jgi:tRNA (mo5U34)-methyltransferase
MVNQQMQAEEIRRRAERIQWFHTMDLGHGVVTRGVKDPRERLARLAMPADLSGKTVLDIGAWDGFFSFEAERRGAKRVLAVDSFCWTGPGWGKKAGFLLAREALGSRVEDLEAEVLDLSAAKVGVFDLVLFLGVLYHMKHPLLALERVAEVTVGQLILETEVDLIGLSRPAAAFYPGDELNRDPTNWWAPNPAALAGMLRAVGFARVEAVSGPRPFLVRAARACKQLLTERNNPLHECRRDRMVVHAWRTPH